MDGVNRVILLGNLGADAEMKYTNSGEAMCRLRIATSETWKDKSGEKKERSEWHTAVLWGKRAEALGKYLTKGSRVYIEGKLTTRQWEDKDGNKRFTTEVRVDDIKLQGGGKRDGGGGYERREQGAGDGFPPDDFGGGAEDDLPFAAVDERVH